MTVPFSWRIKAAWRVFASDASVFEELDIRFTDKSQQNAAFVYLERIFVLLGPLKRVERAAYRKLGSFAGRMVAAEEAKEAERQRLAKKPSKTATFLFYLFLDFKNANAQVGDIEERFPRVVKKYGLRKAQRWVWSEAVRSLGPIIWAWGKKAAGLTALYDLWKKMMS